ncbi:MAG: hypothetical protein QOD39_3264 [Mycobacterium sp.]|jgi:hypothetical protein|nr:hypothetical protein [Mycobacterium sp.]
MAQSPRGAEYLRRNLADADGTHRLQRETRSCHRPAQRSIPLLGSIVAHGASSSRRDGSKRISHDQGVRRCCTRVGRRRSEERFVTCGPLADLRRSPYIGWYSGIRRGGVLPLQNKSYITGPYAQSSCAATSTRMRPARADQLLPRALRLDTPANPPLLVPAVPAVPAVPGLHSQLAIRRRTPRTAQSL